MQVAVLEMPQEDAHKVVLDGNAVRGHIKKNNRNGRWTIHVYDPADDVTRALKIEPHSREAAGMLLLYHHLELERKHIEQQRDKHMTTTPAAES